MLKRFRSSCLVTRRTTISRIAAVLCVAVLSQQTAQAQSSTGISVPIFTLTDQNGVNLVSGQLQLSLQDLSIGPSGSALSHSIHTNDHAQFVQQMNGANDAFSGQVAPPSVQYPNCAGSYDVSLGSSGERMGMVNGVMTSIRGTGTTLVTNADHSYTYTMRDGTVVTYGLAFGGVAGAAVQLVTQIQAPDGRTSTVNYKTASVPSPPGPNQWVYRIQSVTRNDGYQLKYRYAADGTPTQSSVASWQTITSITALNNTIDYCDPLADACSYTQTWPAATYSWTTSGTQTIFTVTDQASRSTRYTMGATPATPQQVILGIKPPTSATADTVSFAYCQSGANGCLYQGVQTVTAEGYAWPYKLASGTGGGGNRYQQYSYANPVGGAMAASQAIGPAYPGPLQYFNDESLRQFNFDTTACSNRVSSVAQADGDSFSYLYDARGNVTQSTHSPAAGSQLSPVVMSANYDATCTYPVKCNKPNWVTDGNGNETDYTYSMYHGGATIVTAPPDNSGVRPQKRYTYTARYAWFKNSAGSIVQSPTYIWLLTQESYCRKSAATGSPCAIAGDEVVTNYDYGPTSGTNNLLLRGTTVTADGVTHRTCYGYDIYGNKVSETSPNAALASCP